MSEFLLHVLHALRLKTRSKSALEPGLIFIYALPGKAKARVPFVGTPVQYY